MGYSYYGLLKSPGLTQQAMADILEVEPISVWRLVGKLEARSFIERRRDPKDRRVWRLHSLPAAEPIIMTINNIRKELNESIMHGLGLNGGDALVYILLALKQSLLEERELSAQFPTHLIEKQSKN